MQFGLISVATKALQNSQAGMRTTSSNISNASVEGYNRQSLEFKSAGSTPLGTAGFIGNGAVIARISRVSSSFLQSQVIDATSATKKDEAMQSQINTVDTLLGDMNSGLSSAMSSFSADASALAGAPSSPMQRDAFINSANTLANKFQDAAQNLRSSTKDINNAITQSVSEVNTYTDEIAKMNGQMMSMNQDMIPSEMLDERDRMVVNLAEKIGIKIINGKDGSFGVYTKGGQPLVMGANSFKLQTTNTTNDPQQVDVGFVNPGMLSRLNADNVGGGQLGGLLEFREKQLIPTSNEIGRIAAVIAEAVNTQSKKGQTESGMAGADLFFVGRPATYAASENTGNAVMQASITNAAGLTGEDYALRFDGTNWRSRTLPNGLEGPATTLASAAGGITLQVQSGSPSAGDEFVIQPTRLAAAGFNLSITDPRKIPTGLPVYGAPSKLNQGSGLVSSASVTDVPWPANIKTAGDIKFTAPSQWTFNGAAMTTSAVPGGTLVGANGWAMNISGTPSDGDKFSVSVNASGGDGSNMQSIASLINSPLIGGSTSPQNAFSRLVGKVGGYSQATSSALTAHTSLLDAAKTQQQDLSGVNLDEETAKLVQQQQAYQAAAKIIQIAMSLFDTINSLR